MEMIPTNGVDEYRTKTLEAMLTDYLARAERDWWDRERIKAIQNELKQRQKRKEKV
jgi:ATP-dependent Lon protease